MLQFFNEINADLIDAGLGKWQESLPQDLAGVLKQRRHGKVDEWRAILSDLPVITPSRVDLDADSIIVGEASDCDVNSQAALYDCLQRLHPWRKGPYQLFGIDIETEWHSDWKWQRLQGHISPLNNRSVLDIGCGNGYHMWRMLGEGARLVIGADPSQFFLVQFQVIKRYIEKGLGQQPIHLLPFKGEELPAFNQQFKGRGFDSVFSMGVLYHRISPLEHLQELRTFLRSGGELVLETLIIEGDKQSVLIPQDRYAKMRNVWFLPSVGLLERMLERAGFVHIRVVDINQTSLKEQRATPWMQFESLADFLDPNDVNKTIEGYPAPKRAVVIANRP